MIENKQKNFSLHIVTLGIRSPSYRMLYFTVACTETSKQEAVFYSCMHRDELGCCILQLHTQELVSRMLNYTVACTGTS